MNVVIIGATSAIAQEVARIYAAERASLVLVARDEKKLAAVASDLRVRGAAGVTMFVADLADLDRHPAVTRAAGPEVDVVLIAHGSLPAPGESEAAAFHLNATSVISIAGQFAGVMERARHGVIAVIGSVAGDRIRRANYLYGAAKAAVHAYCEGLRARLSEAGVAVVLIKPGWVDTPMTSHMRKNPLFSSPASVARVIHAAIGRRKGTVYAPGYWRWISLIVRMLPQRLLRF